MCGNKKMIISKKKKATEYDESQLNRYLQQTFETYVENQQTIHIKQQVIRNLI